MRYIVPLLWMRWKPSTTWVPHARRPLAILLVLEFGILTALFGLTGYAEPNTYRNNLRQDGALSGFNGYPGVNGYTESSTPQVYRLSSTIFDLWWTIASFFMMLLQVILNVLSILPPMLAAIISVGFLIVWIFNLALLQAGASAPAGQRPWWVTRPCSKCHYPENEHYCAQAKAILGLGVCLIVVYTIVAALAIWSVRDRRLRKGAKGTEEEPEPEVVDENMDPFLITPRQSRACSVMPTPQATPTRQSFPLEGRADTSLMGKMKKAKAEIVADVVG